MLRKKYSDIQKQTERKRSQQNGTKNKAEKNYEKSETPLKTSRKEGINSSSRTPNIFNTETSAQELTEKNNPTENKTKDEQEIKSSY